MKYFAAEEGTDGTVTGTFNLQFNGGGMPVNVDGTFTDGTTDGNTFTLSGEHSVCTLSSTDQSYSLYNKWGLW